MHDAATSHIFRPDHVAARCRADPRMTAAHSTPHSHKVAQEVTHRTRYASCTYVPFGPLDYMGAECLSVVSERKLDLVGMQVGWVFGPEV
jgi:hypothetical protein